MPKSKRTPPGAAAEPAPIVPDANGVLTLQCPHCKKRISRTVAPAPAPPTDDPNSYQQFHKTREELRQDYQRRLEQIKAVFDFFENGHDLEAFEYFRLIHKRDRGSATPVEEFICDLIREYGSAEREGLGLTMKAIESDVETLREDLPDVIKEAHFIADRYPKQEEAES